MITLIHEPAPFAGHVEARFVDDQVAAAAACARRITDAGAHVQVTVSHGSRRWTVAELLQEAA